VRDVKDVMTGSVLVVTGLQFEAEIAAAGDAGVEVICRQNASLASLLETKLSKLTPGRGCSGIVSFGTMGGLIDGLRPGDWVIAQALLDGAQRIACDAAWSQALLRALPQAHYADIAGVAAPVASTEAKRALHAATGASAADMESQIVARIAQAHALPFVCCRVVIDPVERSLPHAALAGMREDGSVDVKAVLRSLFAQPGQLPALLALARDARIARRALGRGRGEIGYGFGFERRA
jgi:hopanoid-associated phosphorylase